MPDKIRSLIKRLSDQYSLNEAVAQLVTIGEPAVAPMIAALDTPDQVCQGAIVQALTRIGQPAIPLLVDALASESQYVQGNANNALRLIGRRIGASCLPVLRDAAAIDSDHPSLRAIGLLVELDPASLPSLQRPFADALGSSDQAIAAAAVTAAVAVGEAAIPFLRPLLGDGNPYKQQNATNALIAIGPRAIGALVPALGNDSQLVQQNARRALVAIGAPAVAALRAEESSENPTLRANVDLGLESGSAARYEINVPCR